MEIITPAQAQAATPSAPAATPATPTPTTEQTKPIDAATPKEGEAKPAETPKEPEPPKEDPRIAARFAALSRKDKEVREQLAKVKDFEAKQKAFDEELAAAKGSPDALFKFIKEKFGYDYDDLTVAKIEGKIPDKRLLELQKRVETQEEMLKRKEQEAAQAEIEGQKNKYKGYLYNQLKDSTEFPCIGSQHGDALVIEAPGTEVVFDIIDAHYEKHGEVLPEKEAMKIAEKWAEKELEVKFKSLLKLAQVKGWIPAPAPAAPPSEATPGKSKPSQTLTNAQSAVSPSRHTPETLLPDKDSIAKAAKLLVWK